MSINRGMDKEDVAYTYIHVQTHTHAHTDTHTHTNEYYSAIKIRKFCHLQQHGWTLQGKYAKEIRQKKTNIVWYHLYVDSKKYNKLVNITKKKQTHIYKEQLVFTSEGSEAL